MAVASLQRPIKKTTGIKRVLVNGLCLSFLGWLMLIGWSLLSWVNEGFERAYQKVQLLALQQVIVVQEFSDVSFAKKLSQWVGDSFYQESERLLKKAQNSGEKLTQAAQHQMGEWVQQSNNPIAPELKETLAEMQLKSQQLWLLFKACGHLLKLKLAIVVAAIPLFLLSIAAGLVDGLNQRAIRTASLGRESTYVFHKSIPLARKALFWVLGLWLALPHAIPPSPVFITLSVLLALVVSMTSSRFKKYL